MNKNAQITITSDFGLSDHYTAAMKGAILSINPAATITDISHLIPAQDIMEGAFTIASAYSFFPVSTVHVAVVDPGVGSDRRGIVIETERYLFVGPDNGIFSLALKNEKIVRTLDITNSELMLPEVSATFHGRDIFAPVAAHLTLGIDPATVGEPLDAPETLAIPSPTLSATTIEGIIIQTDRFGNLITNITGEEIKALGADERRVTVDIGRTVLRGIHLTYSSVGKGELIALIGSSGFMEIAANMASAKEALGSNTNDPIRLTVR